jgi:ATP-dependent Clp protease ATP-binding subunit ClpA
LSKEAEKTIRLTETERILHNQKLIYPSHFFLAALKNKNSFLFECFKKTENAYDRLTKYYEEFNDFEKSKDRKRNFKTKSYS